MNQEIIFKEDSKKHINARAKAFIVNLLKGCISPDVNIEELFGPDETPTSSYRNNPEGGISAIDDKTISEIRKLAFVIKEEYGQMVSVNFIEKTIENWLFDSKNITLDLSSYLQNKMNESIKPYRFAFPIHIARWKEKELKFSITNDVSFETQIHPAFEKYLYPQFAGELTKETIYACVTVEGELEYAKEKAFDKCSFAIDIFKMCSDFSRDPNARRCCFEIRSENVNQDTSVCLFWESSSNKSDERRVNVFNNSFPTEIDSAYLDRAKKRKMSEFSEFYSECYSITKTKLHNVLKRAIVKYGSAISEHDIYERIEGLCSVMDILILEQKGSIVMSLKKYVPVIIEDLPEKRQEMAKFLGTMYNIRSKYIHHGEKINVSWMDAYYLGFLVFNLIYRIMILRDSFSDIGDIYQDIDISMNSISFHPINND